MQTIVRRIHGLRAEAAKVNRSAAEAAAAHRDIRATRYRPTLEAQVRHGRLRIVAERNRIIRVLLVIDAHLHSHAALPERGARPKKEVVHQMHVMVRLTRASAKADPPRRLWSPIRQRHVLDNTHSANPHIQALVAVRHLNVREAPTAELERLAVLRQHHVSVPHLQPTLGRQELNRQCRAHAALAKVRRWQSTNVEAHALATRTAANVHIELCRKLTHRLQSRNAHQSRANLLQISSRQTK